MIIAIPPFVEHIRERLSHASLPGHEAHLRMAHAVRRAEAVPDPDTHRKAAVLITFYQPKPDEWDILFIRRTSRHAGDKHAGQIAFPGGKMDPTDRDLMYTALRESEEEVGMDLTKIDVLGALTPMYITVSKFLVHPYVAYYHGIPDLRKQESEIEDILSIPLIKLLDRQNRVETKIKLEAGIILNHVPAFQVDGDIIWGATAMILNELVEVLEGA